MFTGGDAVGARRIEDEDASFGGCIKIDVVDANARAGDNAQSRCGREYIRGHHRFAANDQCVRVADDRKEIGFDGAVDIDQIGMFHQVGACTRVD